MGSNGIKHVRIDERLIHGQVATMWTNTIKTNRIMIVDDAVVKSDMEKVALKTAVPSG
ncbi:PTS sugar transporter subunit IIB, partial [Listeria seeligeri]